MSTQASTSHAIPKNSVATRQAILKQRDEVFANLGRQHNALLPSTLPLELLLKIFCAHKGDHGEPTSYARNVSQVCHYWRKAALQAPFLWSQLIDCNATESTRWFGVVLRRARFSPLKIHIDLDSDYQKVHMALRHIESIGELDLMDDIQEERIPLFAERFQNPAPSLRRLSLEVFYGEPSPGNDIQLFPSHIFNGDCGALRSLELDGCLIDLRAPLYQQLTFLSVSYVPETFAPSISQWLEILRTAPSITHLSLHHAFSLSAPFDAQVQNVHLARLSELRISGEFLRCNQFLSHLQHPRLHTFVFNMSKPEVATANPLLQSKHLYPTINSSWPYIACISDRFTEIASKPRDIGEAPFFSISSSWKQTINPQLMTWFLDPIMPEVSQIEDFHLKTMGSSTPSRESLQTFLWHFSSVKTLIMGSETGKFLKYISVPYLGSQQTDSRTPHILLPQLQHLSFGGKDFLAGDLLQFLQFRKDSGFPISTVRFGPQTTLQGQANTLQQMRAFCRSIIIDNPPYRPVPVPKLVARASDLPVQKPPRDLFDYEGEEVIDSEVEALAGYYDCIVGKEMP